MQMLIDDDDDADDDDDERVTEVHIVPCGLFMASICTCRHNVGSIPLRYVVMCLGAKDCSEDDT